VASGPRTYTHPALRTVGGGRTRGSHASRHAQAPGGGGGHYARRPPPSWDHNHHVNVGSGASSSLSNSTSSVYYLNGYQGYDGVPVDEMEGMGIGSHPGSTYGQVQDMPMDGDFMGDQDMPQPPQDNNQVAAWYDTDL